MFAQYFFVIIYYILRNSIKLFFWVDFVMLDILNGGGCNWLKRWILTGLVVPDPTPPSRPLPLPPKEERKQSTPPISSTHLQQHHRQAHHSQQPPQQPPRNSQLFKQAARKPEVWIKQWLFIDYKKKKKHSKTSACYLKLKLIFNSNRFIWNVSIILRSLMC